jgi:hypothetical protein
MMTVEVCLHYLMEIHVALCAAIPNAAWVEYIPQLDVPALGAMMLVPNHHRNHSF